MRPFAAAAALLAVLTVACATGSGGKGAATGPDAEGERLYRGHCGACHRLRDPGEQSRDGWARAVDKYGPRAHLAPEDRALVLGYLQARASDAQGSKPEGEKR
jgi:mono/diheme cytochrome c family protein